MKIRTPTFILMKNSSNIFYWLIKCFKVEEEILSQLSVWIFGLTKLCPYCSTMAPFVQPTKSSGSRILATASSSSSAHVSFIELDASQYGVNTSELGVTSTSNGVSSQERQLTLNSQEVSMDDIWDYLSEATSQLAPNSEDSFYDDLPSLIDINDWWVLMISEIEYA